MSTSTTTPFAAVDHAGLTAVEVTTVSPSLGDLVLTHERKNFEDDAWTSMLAMAETPAGSSTNLGYSYVSGYRLQTEDQVLVAKNLAAPTHLTDPIADVVGTVLNLRDQIWAPALDDHGTSMLIAGEITAIQGPLVEIAVFGGTRMIRFADRVIKV